MNRFWLPICLIATVLAFPCLAQQPNPITNGGFEQLDANGFPLGWSQVGQVVSITHDAHSGHNALLLDRNAAAIKSSPETGLNRVWAPDSGKQGTMLSQLKGAVRFWYKVPSAPAGTNLEFFVIPMSDKPLEDTGSQRAGYQVPETYFGDGKWHEGIVAYDFTDNPKVKWVHISPRNLATQPASWILDDIEYLPIAGALPSVTGFSLDEVKGHEGRQGVVSLIFKNQGDQPLTGTADLKLPDYLKSDEPLSQPINGLAPKSFDNLKWHITGLRDQADTISVSFTGAAFPVSRELRLAPDLSDVHLETKQFVLWPDKETTVSVVVVNDGNAAATNIQASLKLPAQVEAVGATSETMPVALPKSTTRLDFRLRATKQTPSAMLHCAWDAGPAGKGDASAEIVVGAPPPTTIATLPAGPNTASVACDSFDIVFPKNDFGYGLGWVYSKTGGQLLGAIPRLGRLIVRGHEDHPLPLFASSFDARPTVTPLGAPQPLGAAMVTGLTFHIDKRLLAQVGVTGPVDVTFATTTASVPAIARTITWQVSAPNMPRGSLLALDGPMLYAGEGAGFAAGPDECLYPGLEWLKSGEESSSHLEIAPTHPDRIRYVVNPHMVTIPMMAVRYGSDCLGLLWNGRTTWNSGPNRPNLAPDESDNDRPSPVFASPDRFEGHASPVMGLFVPTVPAYVDMNKRVATKGWPAAGAGGPIKLLGAFYVDTNSTSVLDAMRTWFDIYGVVPPRQIPHIGAVPKIIQPPGDALFRGYNPPAWLKASRRDGKYTEPTRDEWIKEMDWSSQAYLKTLWVPDKNGWYSSKGGPALYQKIAPDPSDLYDCVLDSRLTHNNALRTKLQDRIAFVKRLNPGIIPQGADLSFNFGQPVANLLTLTDQAAGLIATQPADGGWKFHARVEAAGLFKGRDYGLLGHEGQEALGLTARNAYDILRCARMTGDAQALSAGLKSLAYMDKFHIPRAAQVWEVPVHAPDILAASDACEAYLEAYRITGNQKYLDRAVHWEETGLPFVYQWDVNAFPFLRYASIPVFGASWLFASWFGRPVQWNGLRWANAALKLSEVDHTYPWRTMAEGVTISAMYQQGTDKDDLCLWPDSIGARDASRSGWLFPPHQILENVYKILGYEPAPITARVKAGAGTILINACGHLTGATLDAKTLRFTLDSPAPLSTRVVLCGVTEPQTITLNGLELPHRKSLDPGEVVGWVYHSWEGIIEISPGRPGRFEVEVTPVAYREVHLLSQTATKIDFNFSTSDGGWRPANDLTSFTFANGLLLTQTTGGDPYMVRTNCRVDGDSVSRLHVRMSVSAGQKGEVYWTTADSPVFAEDKTVKFALQADGKMHDYEIAVGKDPMWKGKTITGLRLDPGNGAIGADVKVDFIRGEK